MGVMEGLYQATAIAACESRDKVKIDACSTSWSCRPVGACPCHLWAASSAGRAPRSQRGGREFEPPAVHQELSAIRRFPRPLTSHRQRLRLLVPCLCATTARPSHDFLTTRPNRAETPSGSQNLPSAPIWTTQNVRLLHARAVRAADGKEDAGGRPGWPAPVPRIRLLRVQVQRRPWTGRRSSGWLNSPVHQV